MDRRAENKQFLNFVVPSVVGMIVSALYVVIDGIFVGQGVGDNALASINIAVPFITLIMAFASMIGVGGAVLISQSLGRGKEKEGNKYFLNSLYILLIIVAIISLLGVVFPYKIAQIIGASSILLDGTAVYIRYYSMFGVFFAVALALSSYVRSDGSPTISMVALIIGAITNIVLDYIFIFPLGMGIAGAAVASGLGQISSVLILLLHFKFNKNRKLHFKLLKFDFSLIKNILVSGTPECIVQISNAVTILGFNLVIIRLLGDMGVAAYSIISYISTILIALFIGVTQGVLPLISYSYGANDKETMKRLIRKTLIVNVGLASIIYLLIYFFGDKLIAIFTSNSELIKLTFTSARIYFVSFIIAAINLVYICYKQATEQSKEATICSILRGIVFIVLGLVLMPKLFGENGIWMSIIFAEVMTLLVISFRNRKINKEILSSEI